MQVGGLVNKPRTFDLGDIMKNRAHPEERIYRNALRRGVVHGDPVGGHSCSTRCSSRWSPPTKAKFVAFQSAFIEKNKCQKGQYAGIDLPYVEGLRLDEAMHPLTLLALGMVRRDAAESGRRADSF